MGMQGYSERDLRVLCQKGVLLEIKILLPAGMKAAVVMVAETADVPLV